MSLPRLNWSKDGTILYELNNDTNLKTSYQQASTSILDGDVYTSDTIGSISSNSTYNFLFNFPDSITINKIGFKIANPSSWDGEVWKLWGSSDSTDGVDGTWEELLDFNRPSVITYTEYTVEISGITWLRGPTVNKDQSWYNFSIFGEYENANIELWDALGTEKLSYEYLFSETTLIENSSNYSGCKQFKIKNSSTMAKDYTITISPLRYGGDLIISDYVSLSTDGGTTKSPSVTIYSVQPDTLSDDVIDLWTDIEQVNNPADGWHYFSIEVQEI